VKQSSSSSRWRSSVTDAKTLTGSPDRALVDEREIAAHFFTMSRNSQTMFLSQPELSQTITRKA
jgi:hypothetical protein